MKLKVRMVIKVAAPFCKFSLNCKKEHRTAYWKKIVRISGSLFVPLTHTQTDSQVSAVARQLLDRHVVLLHCGEWRLGTLNLGASKQIEFYVCVH